MAAPSKPGIRVEVSRDLGLADVTALGVGSMIGAGIFVLLAPATQAAGLSTILALGISGLVVLLSAVSYAELASIYPVGGGGYIWAKQSLPPPSGFLAGWSAWAGHSAALALSAMSLSAFALFSIGGVLSWVGVMGMDSFLSNPTYVAALKVGALIIIIGFISSTRLRGRIRAGRLPYELILKIVLVLVFVVTVFAAAVIIPPGGPGVDTPFLGMSGWAGLPLAMAFTFVAYEGYEIIALSATEVKNPHKNIPRGILLSVGLVVLLYVLLEMSLLFLARYDCVGNLAACAVEGARGELSLPTQSLNHLGPEITAVLLVAAIAAMLTAVGNNLSSATRLSYVMANDGSLPRRLARAGTSDRLPNRTLLVSGLLATAFVFLLDIPQIAIVASILYLILFAFVDAALIATRRGGKEVRGGFKVPLVPMIPILGIATNLALAATLWNFPILGGESIAPGHWAWYVVLLWLTLGAFYHFFAGGRRLVSQPEEQSLDLSDILATGKQDIDLKRYRVFVPLREFANVELVTLGAQVAKERGGELSLMNVVEIPRNLPPKAIRFSYVNDRIRELEKLTKMTEKEGVDTRASVKIGHKVYEIIIDTLGEEDVNLLVLGWRGGRDSDGRILGSNIDYLVETAPCDVIVFKTKGFRSDFKRLLLVAGPSFSLEGISDIAMILAKDARAEIKVLVMAGHESELESASKSAQALIETCRSVGIGAVMRTIVAKDLEGEVKRESADCGLVLMGSPIPRGTRKLTLSPAEERLAKILDKPVILFRKGTPHQLAF